MRHLLTLLFLLASWFERERKQIQQAKDQEERDLSENSPNAWFDAEFSAGDRVRKLDAGGTHQTNAD